MLTRRPIRETSDHLRAGALTASEVVALKQIDDEALLYLVLSTLEREEAYTCAYQDMAMLALIQRADILCPRDKTQRMLNPTRHTINASLEALAGVSTSWAGQETYFL